MPYAHIDLETRHRTDLVKCGTYRAAEDTEILMCAYAMHGQDVQIWDCTDGAPMPDDLRHILQSAGIIKVAHNAQFERTMISQCWGIPCPPEQWRCTQVMALTLGMPSSLAGCAEFLKLDEQKDTTGKKLIRLFSMPQKPTKKQPKIWVGKEDFPQEWEQFKAYCVQDVRTEMAIFDKLLRFDLLPEEWALWELDQHMNDRGVQVDRRLIENAIAIDDTMTERLLGEAVSITGLSNPNSVAQLKQWLLAEHGEDVESLNKAALKELQKSLEGDAQRMIEIRQQLGKTSIDKYRAMRRSVCSDGRIRGLLQFYGAQRTGRWAGRLVQVQNLISPKLEDLGLARELLLSGDAELIEMMFGNPQSVLSELIRTAFVPAPGHRLLVCDESAIEARVLAWGAGEKWRLDVFNSHGKIYEASASEMFRVPIEKIKKGNPEYALRQKGKISELALGYMGSSNALITMGALNMGLTEAELPGLVSAWREANPAVCKFWYAIENDALQCVRNKAPVKRERYGFEYDGGILFMVLPSGRKLAYPKAKIENNRFGKPAVQFWGLIQATKKWGWLDTYGGKLVENWCQAVSRDVLRDALFTLRDAGYDRPLFTVHDEIVFEVPNGFGSLTEVEGLMAKTMRWAPDLPLKSAGFESAYYKKD